MEMPRVCFRPVEQCVCVFWGCCLFVGGLFACEFWCVCVSLCLCLCLCLCLLSLGSTRNKCAWSRGCLCVAGLFMCQLVVCVSLSFCVCVCVRVLSLVPASVSVSVSGFLCVCVSMWVCACVCHIFVPGDKTRLSESLMEVATAQRHFFCKYRRSAQT